MTIQEIYNNEIKSLGENYEYTIYYIDDEYNVNQFLLIDLDEITCLTILENIKNNPTFRCWALDSFCLGTLPYPINN